MTGDPPDFDPEPDLYFKFDDQFATAIGRLAMVWSRVELTIQLLCVCLTQGKAPNALMLAASLGSKTIVDYLNAFEDAKIEKTERFGVELKLISAEFNRLLGLRNRVVHGQWHYDEGSTFNMVMRFKGKVRTLSESWTVEQINVLSAECQDLCEVIAEFTASHHVDVYLNRVLRTPVGFLESDDPPSPAAIQSRDPRMTKLVQRAR